jgi:hypothetical protein
MEDVGAGFDALFDEFDFADNHAEKARDTGAVVFALDAVEREPRRLDQLRDGFKTAERSANNTISRVFRFGLLLGLLGLVRESNPAMLKLVMTQMGSCVPGQIFSVCRNGAVRHCGSLHWFCHKTVIQYQCW